MRSTVTIPEFEQQMPEPARRPVHLSLVKSWQDAAGERSPSHGRPAASAASDAASAALAAAVGNDAPAIEAARRLCDVLRRPVTQAGLVAAIEDALAGLRESTVAGGAALLAHDERETNLCCMLTTGDIDSTIVSGSRIPVNGSVAGWVFGHRVPLVVNDAAHDPRFCRETDDRSARRTRRILAVPLFVADACMGVIELCDKPAQELFSLADLQRAELVAGYIGIAAARLTVESGSQPLDVQSVQPDNAATRASQRTSIEFTS